MIKMILRINSWHLSMLVFCQFSFGALIFYSLSLSYSWTLRVFLEHSWSSVAYFGFGARRKRKSMKAKEDIGINIYNGFCL